MRRLLGALAAGFGLLLATGAEAAAAPSVEISNAVVRVVVSPEARPDVRVDIVRANPRLPLKVWSFMGRTYVAGGLQGRIRGCGGSIARPSALVRGVGQVGPDAIPQIVIHTPMNVRVAAGGAVWGQVGRSESLDLTNAGCGAWEAGNVRGAMRLSQAGSGATRAGSAGAVELSAAGSGAISAGVVDGPANVMDLGSGDIDIAAVNGPLSARIAGSGRVQVAAGRVSAMHASIAGSGGIALGGVAGSLKASVVGSGDIRVARVTGPVSKAVIGSGAVKIGS